VHGNLFIAIQSYLRRSAQDLERLFRVRPKIRLVKGAYHEPPALAFEKKQDVDANFRVLLDRLLSVAAKGGATAAIGTHDPVLIEYAQKQIREIGLTSEHYEFQMIYGIRRDLQQQVVDAGHPLRIYVPFGTAWCPYFMRRLSERPANLWFVLRSLIAER
jgi:proline dehydrogenase